jgi:hypothetical protein
MKPENGPTPEPKSVRPPPCPPKGPTIATAFGDDDDENIPEKQSRSENIRINIPPKKSAAPTVRINLPLLVSGGPTGKPVAAASSPKPWWKFW